MIKFKCPCGADTYFDSVNCMSCGRTIGLNPNTWAFELIKERSHPDIEKSQGRSAICNNGFEYGVCNWIQEPDSQNGLCLACSFNRYIPRLDTQENISRWKVLELAKRRLLFNSLRLNIRWSSGWVLPNGGLLFDFLEDSRTSAKVDPTEFVSTGYSDGVITINLLEADPAQRAAQKTANNEVYRTVLGHMRHESGHYIWDLLHSENETRESFKHTFGDPEQNYHEALTDFYSNGQSPEWAENYITPYASSHPVEDWAEMWGHFLHIIDGLETAKEHHLIGSDSNQMSMREKLAAWQDLTIKLNEMNRSMGRNDLYPFVICEPVVQKFEYIDELISGL